MIETRVFCDRCKCEIYQAEAKFNILTSHENKASDYQLCSGCSMEFLEWIGMVTLIKPKEESAVQEKNPDIDWFKLLAEMRNKND